MPNEPRNPQPSRGSVTKHLLFPGRHLCHTQFQEEYLTRIISETGADIVIFAITSANQEDCRYNPIPFPIRVAGCDRFAQDFPGTYRLLGIPHYPKSQADEFCQKLLKHCEAELEEKLTPENTEVIISTPGLMEAWQKLGFTIHKAEAELPKEDRVCPIDIITSLATSTSPWYCTPKIANLSKRSKALFSNHEYLEARIRRIWTDPLSKEDGNLCENRKYRQYGNDMQANVARKAEQIIPHILPGRISDEGCADGTLFVEIARELPESDLIGVDLSSEFAAQFKERARRGDFNHSFAQFYHRNLLKPIFESNSIDTVICNSTLHEIFSYMGGKSAVEEYLKLKLEQLKPGGRLVARDIVGPPHSTIPVFLLTDGEIGKDWEVAPITQTNPSERLLRFINESPWITKENKEEIRFDPWYEKKTRFLLPFGIAMEFAHRIDYTENWDPELAETFCFWTHQEWIQMLENAGFHVLLTEKNGTPATRTITEGWLVKTRFDPQMKLTTATEVTLRWPETHHVLVAEKPKN